MMTKGKVNNPDSELRTAYARHDIEGMVRYLTENRDRPEYSELYSSLGKNPRHVYDRVGDYLKNQTSRTEARVTKPQFIKKGEYEFEIFWPYEEEINKDNEVLDVRIRTKDGRKFASNFTTLKFIKSMFEKNKRTGECVRGKYFCMPRMVVLERLTRENIRATIEDLVENKEIEDYFEEL